jgi:hypothetical protein
MSLKEGEKDYFHEVFGGRKSGEYEAGFNLGGIATRLGVSISLLSLAAGGRLGGKSMERIQKKLDKALEPDVQI